jgi:hypothetical protein
MVVLSCACECAVKDDRLDSLDLDPDQVGAQ